MKLWVPIGLAVVAWAACGGNAVIDGDNSSSTGQGGGSTSTSTATTGPGAGGCNPDGDCDTDGDCPTGSRCVQLTNCGYRVCEDQIPEATQCNDPNFDECCTSADCGLGKCYFWPFGPFCGGVQPLPHNVCVANECESDDECTSVLGKAICTPPNTLGSPVRQCLGGTCRTDADCTEEAGGKCVTVTDPCCSGPNMLACVYADGCRDQQDCSDNTHCGLVGARAKCVPGLVACPAG